VETVEEIREGNWRVLIRRRSDGLLELVLERWYTPEEDTYGGRGFWAPIPSSVSKTDDIEIARSLAKEMLADRGHLGDLARAND